MTVPNDDVQHELQGEELWRHSSPKSTPMWKFLERVNSKHGLQLSTYPELHQWSVENTSLFWAEVWDFVGIRASKPYNRVVDESLPMFPRPAFFEGARLNFAENLLYPPVDNIDPKSLAIIAATEVDREEVTWEQLRLRVAACQAGLRAVGLKQGERVAGFVGNHVDAIVAMLAATSLGAIWTGISPDSGAHMVLDRLTQVEPTVLFADRQQFYNGKTFDVLPKVREIVAQLPSLKTLVIVPLASDTSMTEPDVTPPNGKTYTMKAFTSLGGEVSESNLTFEQLPADQPIYVLYSSGTTGAPKAIVHGAIGTLLQHKKEHILHCSVLPGDRFFYFTTATWMMWHWLVGGLAAGATLILYDGSPMRYRSGTDSRASMSTELAMPRLIQELQIKHFGTSAKYLSVLEQASIDPRGAGIDLSPLRAIYNTASPLAPSTFRYVYRAFGPDVHLASITGGTDIISLFAAGTPLLPVHAGEIQAAGLGMAIRAFVDDGSDITHSGEPGDLVCVKPFPCQPVAFWGGEKGHAKYKSSYFEKFTDKGSQNPIWHHGDFVQFNPRTDGGVVMLGRSDGVLNPAGVRFGSAEIYNVMLKHFAGRVADALCIGRKKPGDVDETVCLFVKMEDGKGDMDEAFRKEIKTKIRNELSPRHVPGVVECCPDIPVTVNGKKVESAVKQIISGSTVKPSASVANAECLDFFRDWAAQNP